MSLDPITTLENSTRKHGCLKTLLITVLSIVIVSALIIAGVWFMGLVMR